jgi:hypothetical protein
MSLAHAAGTDGLKAILRTRTPSTMSRAPRRDEPQATPTELAANESRPTQPGQVANGTTTVRWDLSRPSAGRHSPQRAQGNPIRRPTTFRPNSCPTLPRLACPHNGDGWLKSHPKNANSVGDAFLLFRLREIPAHGATFVACELFRRFPSESRWCSSPAATLCPHIVAAPFLQFQKLSP